MILTDVKEFDRFHARLTRDYPDYKPWYILLKRNSKNPEAGIAWKQESGRLTYEKARKFMMQGHNIGIVATGLDKLVILDRDDLVLVGDVKPTLSTTSRKRIGDHNFYFTDEPVATDKDLYQDTAKQNIPTENAGELRSNWQYVVVTGSYVEFDLTNPKEVELLNRIPDAEKHNAGKYTIKSDANVASITYQELPAVFKNAIEEKRKADKAKKEEDAIRIIHERENHNLHNGERNTTIKSRLWDLSLGDVIGTTPNRERFSSLFHDSNTGTNTSISNGLLHCWRHMVFHSPLSALAVDMGLITCSQGYSHGSGVSSLNLRDGQTVFKLWEGAKKRGLIPKDDPIPSRALKWYAISHKFCTETDFIDGWKLPHETYIKTIIALDATDTLSGRKISEQYNSNIHKEQTSGQPGKQKKMNNRWCSGFTNAMRGVQGEHRGKVAVSFVRALRFWKDADENQNLKAVKKFCKLCQPPLDFDIIEPQILEFYTIPIPPLPICNNMILSGLCEQAHCKTIIRRRQEQEKIAFLQLQEIIKNYNANNLSSSLALLHSTAPETPATEPSVLEIITPDPTLTLIRMKDADRKQVIASAQAWEEAKGKRITQETVPDVLAWIFHNTGISTSFARQCIIINIKIKPLKDIPSFVGIDGVLYTLRAGITTTLPVINAKALIKKQTALEVL